MKQEDSVCLKEWFAGFTRSFYPDDQEALKNIVLKEEHTANVCENMERIAREEDLDEERMALSNAVALFHDLGRFPQFSRYTTFKDSISINHGVLGAEILVNGRVLDKFTRNEQTIIVAGVRFHNSLFIPQGIDDEHAYYLKLVRDADKLDIWRVFLDYYRQPAIERASAVSLGFPDVPGWSPQVLAAVSRGEMARLEWVTTLTDFKLLQLSWVFDLNFPSSFRVLRERGFIDELVMTLPEHDDLRSAIAAVRDSTLRGCEPRTFQGTNC